MPGDLTILIVTYNSEAVIEACLETLPKDQRIIVLDNGSTDQTLSKATRFPVEILRNKNIGYGRAANVGLAQTRTRFALLLNPDTRISADSLNALLDCADRHPDIGILGARMFHHGHKADCDDNSFDADGLSYRDSIHGALMLFRMDALKKLGTFDENIFLYYEEEDLCARFRAAGYKLAVFKHAEAEHLTSGSSQPSLRVSKIRAWHGAWSRVYFYRKHFGRRKALCESARKFFNYIPKAVISGLLLNRQRTTESVYKIFGLLSFFFGIAAFDKNDRARLT